MTVVAENPFRARRRIARGRAEIAGVEEGDRVAVDFEARDAAGNAREASVVGEATDVTASGLSVVDRDGVRSDVHAVEVVCVRRKGAA